MNSMNFILLGSMIVLISSIFGILLIPFHIVININKDINQLAGKYRLVWLGMTVKAGDIFAPVNSKISKEIREKSKKDELWIEPKKYSKLNNPKMETLIDALPAIIRFIRELITSLQIELFKCKLFFGFQDPVDTAVTYGYIWSMISAIGICEENLMIEPHFEEERLDGSILAEINAQLIWIFIAIFHAMRNEKLRRLLRDVARRD